MAKMSLKEKLEAARKKAAAGKKGSNTGEKKAAAGKKAIGRKKGGNGASVKAKAGGNGKSKGNPKPIKFNLHEKDLKMIESSFEKIQTYFEQCGEHLNDYLYEGKKKCAAQARSSTMDIIKEMKTMRAFIQESKSNLEPVYKDA